MCIFGFFFLFRLLCIPSSSHTRYLYLSLLYSLTSIRRWWSALVYYLNYALQRFGRLSNSILINSQSHTVWVRLNVILKFCVWASVCSWFVFVFVVSSLELVGRMRAWMGKAQWQINAAQNNFFQFYSDTNEMIILFSAISSKSHDFYWCSSPGRHSVRTEIDTRWIPSCVNCWNRINGKRHVRMQNRTNDESN